MANQLAIIVVSVAMIGLAFGIPVDDTNGDQHLANGLFAIDGQSTDFLQQLNLPLEKLTNTLMSPHITVETNNQVSAAAAVDAANAAATAANHKLVSASTDSGSNGQKSGQILVSWTLPQFPELPAQFEVVEDSDKLAEIGAVIANKTKQHMADAQKLVKAGAAGLALGAAGLKAKVVGLKAGAVALAAKPFIVAKKVAYVAGRLIMKPIAIITGAHLKALGTGLKLAGKVIGGTGLGIAKAGTAVKYTGLGAIGAGASAVAWGFDKTTLTAHNSAVLDSDVRVSAGINTEN